MSTQKGIIVRYNLILAGIKTSLLGQAHNKCFQSSLALKAFEIFLSLSFYISRKLTIR